MAQEPTTVLNISNVARTAYKMGYERFEPDAGEDTDLFDLDGFQSGGIYANHTLPRLRQLAGHDDAGYGTHTVDREVMILSQDSIEELGADAGWVNADTAPASMILDELIEAWEAGVYDAIGGAEPDGRYMDCRVD